MARIDTATLRQATQDVRDFGVVVSEADADRIERANDAISRLGLIWRGLSNQLPPPPPGARGGGDAMAALARTTGPLGSPSAGSSTTSAGSRPCRDLRRHHGRALGRRAGRRCRVSVRGPRHGARGAARRADPHRHRGADRRRRRDGLPVRPAGFWRGRLRRGAVAARRRRRRRSGSGSSSAAGRWRCRCSRSGRRSRPAG